MGNIIFVAPLQYYHIFIWFDGDHNPIHLHCSMVGVKYLCTVYEKYIICTEKDITMK